MIFSMLKINKKISAALAGIAIGAASLWGLSMWQQIPAADLLGVLLAILLLLLLGLALVAFCTVALCKLLIAAAKRIGQRLSK